MKTPAVILSFCIAGLAHAQTLVPEPKPDELPESLLEKEKPEPVTAVTSQEVEIPQLDEEKEPASHGERPDIQPTPDEGISIQVEKPANAADVKVPVGEVKIYSPWPAKPMFPAPNGWKFAPAPEGLSPYRTKAKLSTGQEVDLSITPFVLVPVTDGLSSIRITEPGYRPKLGYVQRDTVGVMLEKSNADLEQNELQAADSIRRLQQLLSSLPKPALGTPAPPAAANTPTQTKP